jgi:large subunit ribosomal protein L17
MRHQVRKNKLNRAGSQRNALVKTLAAQVIQYEHVDTTNAKARVVSSVIDHIITIGKKKDLHARRLLMKELYSELAVKKVLEVLADRYKDRPSGFTSIVKIGERHGDRAEIVRIMLVEE